MRALIDNATLTAALRALALAPRGNKELFDLDIAALRAIVDAIMLADKIIIPDTYKVEHTPERKTLFAHPDVHFQQIPDKLDEKLRINAAAHVHNSELLRRLATDYQGLYDQLGILFRHAWRNSESFLVLKALGVKDKYNNVIIEGMIGDTDVDIATRAMRAKAYNAETKRVVQSLTWAAIRTVYYRQLAKLTGTEYLPHPLRHQFNLQFILFDNHPFARTQKLHSAMLKKPLFSGERESVEFMMGGGVVGAITNFCREFWESCAEADKNVFGISTFDIEMPPFLGRLLAEIYPGMKNTELLKKLFSLRADKEATALRNKLSHAWHSAKDDDPSPLRELGHEFRELRTSLQKHLGYDREHIKISAKLVSYQLTVPRCMTKPYYPFKPHLAFVRDTILELAAVGSMGRLYDLLYGLN